MSIVLLRYATVSLLVGSSVINIMNGSRVRLTRYDHACCLFYCTRVWSHNFCNAQGAKWFLGCYCCTSLQVLLSRCMISCINGSILRFILCFTELSLSWGLFIRSMVILIFVRELFFGSITMRQKRLELLHRLYQ